MAAQETGHVEARPLAVDKLEQTDFILLLDWWEKCRAGRVGPSRTEVDPVELKPVLAHLTLVEFDPETASFRFRLSGTYIHQLHNRDIAYTGVDEMEPPAYRNLLNEHYREVIETGAANAYEIRFISHDNFERHYTSLRLPLSEDGEHADGIVTLDIFGAGWSSSEAAGSGIHPRVD
ncbi:MAG: PAS domain-containing protein [Alphaproteobacteria bacterium]